MDNSIDSKIEIYAVEFSPIEKFIAQAYMAGLMDGHKHQGRPIEFIKENAAVIKKAFREELSHRRNQFSKHPISIVDAANPY